jgi:16S rRNA (cytidine1402-2'-O)-methyltransferase
MIKLAEMFKHENLALVSDCGTPGFCDPGNNLIHLCRKNKVPVKTILGPSALMGLLSLSSQRIHQFLFRGFMPAETESRSKEWLKLKTEKNAIIIMDTPYRLKKTLEEVIQHFNNRDILLVMNLSQEEEEIMEGRPSFVLQNLKFAKAEFMLMIYPA